MSEKGSFSQEPVSPEKELATLYATRLENVAASITTPDDPAPIPVLFAGEVLLYGQFEGESFVPAQLARLSLYGRPNEDVQHDIAREIRAIDVVGPLEETPINHDENRWYLEKIPTRLYYSRLGRLALEGDAAQDVDAIHPDAETLAGELIFHVREDSTPDTVFLEIEVLDFVLVRSIEGGGFVKTVYVEPMTLALRGPGTQRRPKKEPANSLETSCDQTNVEFEIQAQPCASRQNETHQREVKLKFINLSDKDIGDVETWCQQLLHQVCRIWCHKGALDLDVHSQVEPVNAAGDVKPYTDADATGLAEKTHYHSFNRIEVYIVSQLLVQTGTFQGTTYYPGTSEAYIVLDVSAIDPNGNVGGIPLHNENILAHELCHCIGLNHPNTSVGAHSLPGSPGSIAEAGLPNPFSNSHTNFGIFTAPQLSPLVKLKYNDNDQPIPACFNPQ